MRRLAIAGLAGFLLLVPGPFSGTLDGQGTPNYQVEDLGTLGGRALVPRAINAAGHVGGVIEVPDSYGGTTFSAFMLTTGPTVAVPAFGYLPIEVNGLNDTDVVVGSGTQSDGSARAFRYSTAGGLAPLPVLADPWDPTAVSSAYGMAINAAGQVAGYSGAYDFHAIRITAAGVLQDLGTLGGAASYAYGINDAGLVTGCGQDTSNALRAITSSGPGTMASLATLGGSQSCGLAVNNNGQVAGWAVQTNGSRMAFRFTPGQPAISLGLLGAAGSWAADINDTGDVVGWTLDAGGQPVRAVLYTDGSGLVDLNARIDASLGWTLTRATAINNAGQIVGVGLLGGVAHAFRLTPGAPAPPPPPLPPPPPPPPPSDTTPPLIGAITATPGVLWPPQGQMVNVRIAAVVTDDTDPAPSCAIASVASSQPDAGTRGGNRATDFVVTGPLAVSLRAELTPPRNQDRIYTVEIRCADAAGNASVGQTVVRVLRVPAWSNGKPGRH